MFPIREVAFRDRNKPRLSVNLFPSRKAGRKHDDASTHTIDPLKRSCMMTSFSTCSRKTQYVIQMDECGCEIRSTDKGGERREGP